MTTALLLYILAVGLTLLLVCAPPAGLLIAGLTAKKRGIAIRDSRTRSGSGMETVGELTDVQPASAAHGSTVKLAFRFTGRDGQTHSALLGVPASAESPYAVGNRVALWLFPVPVVPPAADALEPKCGADGKICGEIRVCRFMGKPVDETGTVMLSRDYRAYLTESTDRLSRLERASVRFYLAAGIAAFFAGCLLLNFLLT
ncbi:MAG: hypothetical protein II723_08450 [Oscillospiraceae bacterium]|nr:hypothetical protein [Oscillospiraceae bacterium]